MADTFRDGIEAAAQLVEDGDITYVGRAFLRDLAAEIRALQAPTELALDAPLVSRAFSIAVALDAKFREFQTAFLAAGGKRNPKSVDARGWDAARKVFIRLVTKQRHSPDAIVTGTLAFAAHWKARIEHNPSDVDFVNAPEVFLNKEYFTKTWALNGGPKPTGNQRGATSLFDVGFWQSR